MNSGYKITIFDGRNIEYGDEMAQHFLLSAQARTLSLAKVMRLSDQEAYQAFARIRWAQNDGQPCMAAESPV